MDEIDMEQSTEDIQDIPPDAEMNTGDNVEDSDDEQKLTVEEALQALENAWLNEKFAPELLPHEMELVEVMLSNITYMEENLKSLEKGDIRLNIHTMEINRLRFLISNYLRIRLAKIEEFAIYLLSEDAKRTPDEAYMTPAETNFAREYISNIENLFTTVALQYLPSRFRAFELNKMSAKPNMDKYVFIRANTSIRGVLIPGKVDGEVDLEEGSQHVIQYSAVAHLVRNREVQLI